MHCAVKICGLSDHRAIDAAIDAGADYIGLVHFPKSPRHVEISKAQLLAHRARGRTMIVSLVVNPDDALLKTITAVVQPDVIQLHGSESVDRVEAIRANAGCRVWKAVGVRSAADIAGAAAYTAVADQVLFDAKPPENQEGALPGGNGVTFDWTLLQDVPREPAYTLSGGLTPDNVAEALRTTGAPGVDVSSGVEAAPGRKDAALIQAFVQAVRAATRDDRDGASVDAPRLTV